MGKINSRRKGAEGELEWAKICTENGFPMIRGQQFSGTKDSPDVKPHPETDIELPFQFEVKRVQQLNLDAAFNKAVADSKGSGKKAAVAHRKNRRPWLVTLGAEDFFQLCRAAKLAEGHEIFDGAAFLNRDVPF